MSAISLIDSLIGNLIDRMVKELQYYVHIEETFDVIKRAYITTGHCGRDRMVKELVKKYANVTRDYNELLSQCALTVSIKFLRLWLSDRPCLKSYRIVVK